MFFSKIRRTLKVPSELETREEGFSLPEMLVATILSIGLAVIVGALILGAVNIAGRSSANASSGAKSQDVLSKFEMTARDATTIKSVSSLSLKFLYQRDTACEVHTYQFTLESGNLTYRLDHTIASVGLVGGATCKDVDTQLSAGTIGTPTTVTELTGLGLASRFYFYGSDGMQILVSGDSGYNSGAPDAVANCLIGSAALTVVTPILAEGSSATHTETARAAFRSNVMGISC